MFVNRFLRSLFQRDSKHDLSIEQKTEHTAPHFQKVIASIAFECLCGFNEIVNIIFVRGNAKLLNNLLQQS